MTQPLVDLDPTTGEDLGGIAAALAAELRALTSMQGYSPLVLRILKHPSPGLLSTLAPPEHPALPPVRLSALIAGTRHRLDPASVTAGVPLNTTYLDRPRRYPRRTR